MFPTNMPLSCLQASTDVSDEDFVSYVSRWHEAGALLIGGCFRTTPKTIRAISGALHKEGDVFKPDGIHI